MKNSLRLLLGVSALALLVTAAPVMAAEIDVSGENVLTGAESENENEFDFDNDGNVNLTNSGVATNSAYADVETGHNDQEKNTTGGNLESGSVDASTDWENALNGAAAACGCPGDDDTSISADFSNDTTGAKSENENELDVDMDGDMTMNNWANIVNALGLTADTGHNDQEKNTMAGDLETGDVTVDSMIANWANSGSEASHGSSAGVSIDVDASNHLTGAYSENENEVDIDADGDTTVTNAANIVNSINVTAKTGHNDQNKNTTAGDLETGSVDVTTDITNVANSGGCNCPPGRSLDVTADFSNDTTGYKSENENELDVDMDGDTTVTNSATVTNALNVDADTGHNDQEMNTQAGDIQTGNVSINFGVSNTVN